jgi:hypothetical protein
MDQLDADIARGKADLQRAAMARVMEAVYAREIATGRPPVRVGVDAAFMYALSGDLETTTMRVAGVEVVVIDVTLSTTAPPR